jgi:hypothetical protein
MCHHRVAQVENANLIEIMILNVADILNTIIPVWKIKICMPVDTFDLVLNSTTATYCMILLLILRCRPVCTNDITIRLNCFRDSYICAVFLQTVKVMSLEQPTIREQCPRLLSTKDFEDIEADVLVGRDNICMKPISSLANSSFNW